MTYGMGLHLAYNKFSKVFILVMPSMVTKCITKPKLRTYVTYKYRVKHTDCEWRGVSRGCWAEPEILHH